jgi:hypothetical protein
MDTPLNTLRLLIETVKSLDDHAGPELECHTIADPAGIHGRNCKLLGCKLNSIKTLAGFLQEEIEKMERSCHMS